MKRKIFLDSYEEVRKLPVKLDHSEKYIFNKEFKKHYKEVEILTFTKANYINGRFFGHDLNIERIFTNHYLKYIKTYFLQIKDASKSSNKFRYTRIFVKNYSKILIMVVKYILTQLYSIVVDILCIYQSKKLDKIFINKITLLTANWSWTNYFHWNHDFLPLIVYLSELQKETNTIVIPNSFIKKAPYVIETLTLLNIKYLVLKNNFNYSFDVLDIVDANLNPGNQRAFLLKNLRKRFHQIKNLSIENKNEIIYISRRDNTRSSYTNIRNISNEKECIELFEKYNIKTITTLGLRVKEQLDIFSNCKTLIAIHGAGLTNMIFMQPNSNILEIRQEKDCNSNCYFSMSSALDHNYYYLQAENLKKTDIMNASLFVNLDLLENKIREIIFNDNK